MFVKLVSSLLLFHLLALVSHATPGDSLSVTEKFLGSNKTGFVILRTEQGNEGSHFIRQDKHYLDFYVKEKKDPKDPHSPVKLVSSKLILYKTTNRVNYPKLEETIHSQDKEVTLVETLRKYDRQLIPLRDFLVDAFENTDQVTKLAGIDLVSDDHIHQHLGQKENYNEFKWQVIEIMRDDNCYYLKVTRDGEDGYKQRYICILPDKVKLVEDQLQNDDTIINAGEFDGKGKAFAVAQKLNKQLEKIKDRQFYDKFEVWVKGGHRENTRSYVVITTESKKMLIHDQLSSMREHLKQDFKLEGSTGFIDKQVIAEEE